MARLSNRVTDVTTVFGRIVATLRRESEQSQGELAEELGIDKSQLARVEVGRNLATVDNVMRLEETFMSYELLEEHGDLITLTAKVSRALQRRGARVIYGKVRASEQTDVLDPAIVDRVAARVVDRWLETLDDSGDDDDVDE